MHCGVYEWRVLSVRGELYRQADRACTNLAGRKINMIQLGEIQTLKIAKQVEFGVYLYDGENKEERILLPKKQVPAGAANGDGVEVFVYRDSKDRLIATTNMPKITLHGVERLRVVQVEKTRLRSGFLLI